jgi:serine/threonine protein kinase
MGAPPPTYVAFVKLAAGGTATVFVAARVNDPNGELVALKRPHPHVLDDPRQRAALLREARIAATIRHPNVVPVREVEEREGELELVMDYVEGASLATLIAGEASRDARVPTAIAVRVLLDACAGLAAVHAEKDAKGAHLGLVHRDVSPQNILVGTDGVARLTDFGLAKAVYEGAPSTTQGTLKGKLGYMAPEYVSRGRIDASGDVFALGVVAWEALAGRRLFRGDNEAQTLDHLLRDEAPALGGLFAELATFDEGIAKAVAKDPAARVGSASAFGEALERSAVALGPIASYAEVGAYVSRVVAKDLTERRARIAEERRAIRGKIRTRRARVAALIVVPLSAVASIALFFATHPRPSSAPASIAPVESATPTPTPTPTATANANANADADASADANTRPTPPPRHRHAPSPSPTRVAPANPYARPSSPR